MKLPSLVVSVLIVVAIAAVNAAISYFNIGGPGASYIYSGIIVAVGSAVLRYIQEQQATIELPPVTTADGTVTRSRALAKPEVVKNPVNEALLG